MSNGIELNQLFDLSCQCFFILFGFALAVVITTHMSSGSDAQLLSAVLIALACALGLGARFLQWAVVLYRGTRPHAAINTFKYSIYYLFLLFIALLVDHYLMLNL